MGILDFLTAAKKEEKLMQEKTSRAIAIAVSYTAPEEIGEDVGKNFGKAVFKLKKDQVWEEFEVVLRENVDIKDSIIELQHRGGRFKLTNHTGLEISSTEVKRLVKNNENIDNLVDESVRKIIENNGLYKNCSRRRLS